MLKIAFLGLLMSQVPVEAPSHVVPIGRIIQAEELPAGREVRDPLEDEEAVMDYYRRAYRSVREVMILGVRMPESKPTPPLHIVEVCYDIIDATNDKTDVFCTPTTMGSVEWTDTEKAVPELLEAGALCVLAQDPRARFTKKTVFHAIQFFHGEEE